MQARIQLHKSGDGMMEYHAATIAIVSLLLLSHVAVTYGRTTFKPSHAEVWSMPRPVIAEYRLYSAADVSVYHDNQKLTSPTSEGSYYDDITIVVAAFGTTYTLNLHKNTYLFSSSYVEKSVSSDGETISNLTQDNCYYIGIVREQQTSAAAVSTCSGVQGYFTADDEVYNIESVDGTLAGQHRVYRESDSLVPSGKCGHSDHADADSTTQHNATLRRKKRALNWPQDLDREIKVVELFVVNDISQYLKLGSIDSTIKRVKDIVNVASSVYQPLNIYLVLVGIEVWTEKNMIDVLAGNVSITLNQLANYRRDYVNLRYQSDHVHLVTNVDFAQGVVGLSQLTSMCSYQGSVGLTDDYSSLATNAGIVMAHEMGHSFGLSHDTLIADCVCNDPTTHCIMYPQTGGRLATTWSECSKDRLQYSLQHGQDYCLHNVPQTLYDLMPNCGNGVVETGEQCDCGKALSTECNPSCCNSTTCSLMSTAACASGRCCNITSCQLKPVGSICRPADDPCDLSEYCSGADARCPSDVYVKDGTNCVDSAGAAAYCYDGSCQSHNFQCQLWWGPNGTNGVSSCYTRFNTQGTQFGHCGYSYNVSKVVYVPCSSRDVLCGFLWCDGNAENGPRQITNSYVSEVAGSIGSRLCRGVSLSTFYSGNLMPDLGWVPNGASCGNGQMCLNQKCVNVSDFNVPLCPNCNTRGARPEFRTLARQRV